MDAEIGRDVVVENPSFEDVLAADMAEANIVLTADEKLSLGIDPRQQYANVFVPSGYEINGLGVWKKGFIKITKSGDVEVPDTKLCDIQTIITGRYTSRNAINYVEITSRDNDAKEQVIIVPQSDILLAQDFKSHLIKEYNLRIDDDNVKSISKYYNSCISENETSHSPNFKKGEVFNITGWTDGTFTEFVLGSRMLYFDNGKIREKPTKFIDIKNFDLIKNLEKHGTLHGWVKAIHPIIHYPKLRFAMYNSMASLLICPLKLSNHTFGFVGDTSIGKTFTAQNIASLYCNPRIKDGMILNSDVSIAALNIILPVMHDLPIILDEFGRTKEDVRKAFTYMVGNGQTALRSNQNYELKKHDSIIGNAFLTSEVDIVSEFADNGANVRATSCFERPIPIIQKEIIDNVRDGITENYGHIIEKFLEKFFVYRQDVYARYKFMQRKIEKTTDNSITQRKSDYYAAIEVTGWLLEKVFAEIGIAPKDSETIVMDMWNNSVLSSPDVPLAVKALEALYDHAIVHQNEYLIGDKAVDKSMKQKISGWFVYPQNKHDGKFEYLDITKTEAGDILKKLGYDQPLKITRYWYSNNIAVGTQKDGVKILHYQFAEKSASFVRVIRIKMDAVYKYLGIYDENTPEKPLDGISPLQKLSSDILNEKNEVVW